MVAVFGSPRATAPERCLHLTQASGAGHAVAALLAGEAPYRVPASDVLAVEDGGNEEQDDKKRAGQATAARTLSNIPRRTSVAAEIPVPDTDTAFGFGRSAWITEMLSHTSTAEYANRSACRPQ